MKVKCMHGFFIFEETEAGQVSDFMSSTGCVLAPYGDNFTFEDLLEVDDYCLTAKPILNFPAITTFEGSPWEIFEANEIVYDFQRGLVVPILSVVQAVTLAIAGNKYISNGLILPGSTTDGGQRVKEYSAWYSRSTQRWTYTEVDFV